MCRLAVILAFLFPLAGSLRADLCMDHSRLSLAASTTAISAGVQDAATLPDRACLNPSWRFDDGSLAGGWERYALETGMVGLAAGAPVGDGQQHSRSAIHEMPAAPGSDILCLSGVLTLGCCGLLRRARGVLAGSLPEWYHTACPEQIGHSVPYVVESHVLPVCVFERPFGVVDPGRLRCRSRWEAVSCFETQSFLPTTAPRSPPISHVRR